MRRFVPALLLALSACGVETAGTAATGAAIKKQELDQGKKTMEQAQDRIRQATEQAQSRAGAAARDGDK